MMTGRKGNITMMNPRSKRTVLTFRDVENDLRYLDLEELFDEAKSFGIDPKGLSIIELRKRAAKAFWGAYMTGEIIV